MERPNFALLDVSRPEVARLIAAMVQARDAIEHRSWSPPQEPTSEEWWADVLADRRARKRERRTDLAVKRAFYRLADEKRETILVACSKCDWQAAFSRADLIASDGPRSPTECTEALLYGISAEVLVELIDIGLRSWDLSWGRAIIDVMVRR